MISKKAIQAFLNRRLRDYSAVKRLSDARLDEELTKLPGPLPFDHWPKEPFRSQKECFLIAAREPYFLFFKSAGLGKTNTILATIEWRKAQGLPHKALILVPSVTHIDSWEIETKQWAPDLSFVGLYGSSKDRWETLQSVDGDLFVLNYGGLTAMCTSKIKPGSKGKKKKGLEINWDSARIIADTFDGFVADESQKLKNWKSLQSKICSGVSKSMHFRYALTATPFGRNPEDFWMQFYIIDGGETLGYTLSMYRSAFFSTHKKRMGKKKFFEYTFRKKMSRTFSRFLNHGSITCRIEEYHDLPKQNYIPVQTQISDAGITYYNDVVQELKQSKGDRKIINNSFLRLRQLSSGFIGVKSDSGVTELDLPDCPKLDDLIDKISEIDSDRKIIVFHCFTRSGSNICKRLEKEKISYRWLYGGTKDSGAVYREFRDDDSIQILVANAASGSEGLNLQVSRYVMFYESPSDPITREQAEGRIRPHLQDGPVFYYDFVCEGTEDKRILDFIKEGRDLKDELMSDPKQRDKLESINARKRK